MIRNKLKIIIFLVFAFIVANLVVYHITEINKQQRIKVALDDNLKDLQIHFNILLHHQKVIADITYTSTITLIPEFIELFSKIKTASRKEKVNLRIELYNLLKDKYEILNKKGVFQYQFLLPNNESFLRMHKPGKFGDDLTDVREDFKYTNDTHKPIRAFVKGRIAPGFRNVYPLFDKAGNYMGAMEVSFSNESIQKYLNYISGIHTHFIVHKDVFNVKTWKRDDLVLKYLQSSENKDFMLAMNNLHTKEKCIIENKIKLRDIKDDIDKGIKKGDKFALYTLHKHEDIHVDIISFFPIKNITNTKIIAWLVSYEKSDFIYTTLKAGWIIRVVAFFGLLVLFYSIYRILNQKEILKEQVKEKTKELNRKRKIAQKLNRDLEESEHELQLINENLELKIKEEVDKNKLVQEKLFKSEKMVAMGEMIGNIAHQWRQPLSIISTSATGMQIQKEYGMLTDELFDNYCTSINDHAQYLSKTIDDFKNYIQGDRILQESNIKNVVNNFLNLVEGSIKTYNLNVILDLQEDVKCEVYPNELIQCFINIFNNAKDVLKEQDEDTRLLFIRIAQQDDDKVIIKFKDSGGGISDDIIDKIFEPYFTTKHQSQGTGLGLHMIYTLIIEGMSGDIEVKNKTYEYEGKIYVGAEFTITI
ncbi:MAG: GHKL domain-containing protein [Arcobacteraceae bacterium]|nr:GHKL domain-containing protein [Arcobacteraceae bacterium]